MILDEFFDVYHASIYSYNENGRRDFRITKSDLGWTVSRDGHLFYKCMNLEDAFQYIHNQQMQRDKRKRLKTDVKKRQARKVHKK